MRVCACARACVRVHVCEAPIAILTRSGAPEGLIVRLRFFFARPDFGQNSNPRIAITSCSSLYRCKICFTEVAISKCSSEMWEGESILDVERVLLLHPSGQI